MDPRLPLLGASSEPASLPVHCCQGSSRSEMLTAPPGPLGSEKSRALNSGPSDPSGSCQGPAHTHLNYRRELAACTHTRMRTLGFTLAHPGALPH